MDKMNRREYNHAYMNGKPINLEVSTRIINEDVLIVSYYLDVDTYQYEAFKRDIGKSFEMEFGMPEKDRVYLKKSMTLKRVELISIVNHTDTVECVYTTLTDEELNKTLQFDLYLIEAQLSRRIKDLEEIINGNATKSKLKSDSPFPPVPIEDLTGGEDPLPRIARYEFVDDVIYAMGIIVLGIIIGLIIGQYL